MKLINVYCDGIKLVIKLVDVEAIIIKIKTKLVISRLSNLPIISVGFVNIVAKFSGFSFKKISTPVTINKAKKEKIIKFNTILKLPFLNLDPDSFIDFTEDYFELADQDWERQKDHYPEEGNRRVKDNTNLLYGRHNTFLLKYGNNGDTNEQLKEIFGYGNLAKLNLLPDTVLMRLIVKVPGHGIAIHLDDASTYTQKFSLAHKEKAKRLWFPVSPWEDGHFF